MHPIDAHTPRSGGPVRVAVLADDLTGASDTAVQFAEAGWPAFLQRSPQPLVLPDLAAVGQPLNTRAAPSDVAARRTAEAVEAQLGAGVTRLYLKIDSTMRGSVAAQLQGALSAWRRHHPGAFVVLCPAYPAMGRTLSQGRLWVNGQPLERSPAGSDPVTPVKSSVMVELVPGAVVVPALPAAELRAAIDSAAARSSVVVAEAQTPEHLQTLAEVIAGFGSAALPAGSAGLALPLASAWHPLLGEARPAPLPIVRDRIVVLLSSVNEVSRRQVRACQDALARRMQTATLGLEDVADEGRAARWANEVAIDPHAIVLALCAPAERMTGMDKVAAAARVASGLAAAVHALLKRQPAGALILLGGDGAEATLNQIGVGALRVLRRVLEGVPLLETMGAGGEGLLVVTKAGGFGDERTLLSTIEALRGEKE
jgi:uncharacterized protein YgbK (DUF1537 family)